MKETKQGIDWIRIFLSLFIGAIITVVLVIFRMDWWYLTPYKTGRYIAIIVLWLAFSFIVWIKSPKTTDEQP